MDCYNYNISLIPFILPLLFQKTEMQSQVHDGLSDANKWYSNSKKKYCKNKRWLHERGKMKEKYDMLEFA